MFRESYKELGITSIAFPPLGCGNGGLSWDDVGPLMYRELSDLPIEIEIYAPYGTAKEKLSLDFLKNSFVSNESIQGKKVLPLNNRWLLIFEVVRQVNEQPYALHVRRVIFQKICYVLTRSGIETGFTFSKGTYGPYSSTVKESIIALSNANLIVEKQPVGLNMVETHVTSNFVFNPSLYSDDELQCLDKTVDLFCRIKNTQQAEMMTTVIFSYDSLKKQSNKVTEQDVLDDVLEWKNRWKQDKVDEIKNTIRSLLALDWIHPEISFSIDEDFD